MKPTYLAQYRGFEFRCSPQRLDDGAFAPRLIVQDGDSMIPVEIPLNVRSRTYSDPTTAAHLAFAYGRRWVDSGFQHEDEPEISELLLLPNSAPLSPSP